MVDALVGEPANPDLLALLADTELHAPALIDYEVASALRGHTLGGHLPDVRLEDAVADFEAFHLVRYPLAPMIRDVLDLRDNFTVYDAAYVVLARALEVPLVTADTKLAQARSLGIDVRVLRQA